MTVALRIMHARMSKARMQTAGYGALGLALALWLVGDTLWIASPGARGLFPGQADWFLRLRRESGNLRAALEWALQRNVGAGQELAGALWWSWDTRGYLREGYEWLMKMLDASSKNETLIRAKLLAGAAWLAARRGGMQATDVLALRMPLCGYRVLLLVGVLMAIGLAAELAFHFARYAALPARWGLMGWASIGRAAGWPLAVLSVGIVRPIAEELLFRGFLLPALARSRLGFWGAGLVTSALFAAAHYYLFTPDVLMLVGFFLGGLFLVWTLGVTGSLWVPMAIHMSYNLLALLWLRLWGPL